MFPRFEHAVGDAKMSFVREAGVGCSRFISRGYQVASRGQSGRLRSNPSIDKHRNWAATHQLVFRKVVQPLAADQLELFPLCRRIGVKRCTR